MRGGSSQSPQPLSVSRAIMVTGVVAADVAFRQRCSLDGWIRMLATNDINAAVMKPAVTTPLLKQVAA